MFHPISIVIPILVLLPNLLYFLKKAQNIPSPPIQEPFLLVVLERLGLAGCLIIPVFYPIKISGTMDILATVIAGQMLTVYYIGWIRFFIHNREYRFLYCPLFSVPVPLALSPVLYFLLSSAILHSLPLMISSLILASGHIPNSLKSYQRVADF